jgi:hypothetical protein
MSQIVLAAAGGSPQQDPVGGAITGSAKAFRIDEGLDEPDRVLISWRTKTTEAFCLKPSNPWRRVTATRGSRV